ncbi:MAG: SagB/ThcOx family dehydrogenase [Candidatus Portnoybacteria bacterium]
MEKIKARRRVMNGNDFGSLQPLVIAYGYEKNTEQTVFLGYDREISVAGCNGLLKKLLPLCNGINQLADILAKLKKEYEITFLQEVVRTLLKNEILIDSRYFYWVFHKRSMNPPLYFRELSEGQIVEILSRKNYKRYKERKEYSLASREEIDSTLLDFMKSRRSIWRYSSQEISFQTLSGLLRVAYGIVRREDLGLYVVPHRTVPSGGALYPLEIYIATLVDVGKIRKGLYYFQKERECLTLLKEGNFRAELREMVVDVPETIVSASLFMFVTASFNRECEKYANRGYRHILLEAGHLAQNVYLYCLDQNLDTVELSGFLDEKLADFLGLSLFEESPVTVLAVGGR